MGVRRGGWVDPGKSLRLSLCSELFFSVGNGTESKKERGRQGGAGGPACLRRVPESPGPGEWENRQLALLAHSQAQLCGNVTT